MITDIIEHLLDFFFHEFLFIDFAIFIFKKLVISYLLDPHSLRRFIFYFVKTQNLHLKKKNENNQYEKKKML